MATLKWDKWANQFATRITRQGRTRKFYFGRDKKQAEREFRKLLVDLDSGKEGVVPKSELPLELLAEKYLAFVYANRSKSTYEQSRYLVSRFVREHRGKQASEIGASELEAFKQGLMGEGKAPNTVNHGIKWVKAMYNWAVKFGILDSHKLHAVPKVPVPQKAPRFLSFEEEERLLAACDDQLAKMVAVYVDTGLRLSELAGLTKDNVDLENRRLVIFQHKTSNTARSPKPRMIPMTKRVVGIMRDACEREGYLFPTATGSAYTKDTLRRKFDRAKKRAGLNDVTIHTLRHTFGSRAVMAGIPFKTVADLMGHASTKTTEIYAHLAPEYLDSEMAKLESFREANGTDGRSARTGKVIHLGR